MGKSRIRISRIMLILLISLSITCIYSFWPKTYKWVFVYYLSYDNDLDYLNSIVLRNLTGGISNKEIAVVAQADSIDPSGMKRIELYYSFGIIERKDTILQSEDSADPNELKKYLDWVRNKWKAENYCIVLANHGGLLNSICKDENPFVSEEENKKYPDGKWLPTLEVSEIMRDFNRRVDGKVRLLFFQQCGRASIQSLYNFTDTSEYILSTPVILWSSCTYYIKTLNAVTNNPEITGKALAELIMNADGHHNIFTLIKTDKLKELPEKLSPVLESFLQAYDLKPQQACSHMFVHKDEMSYDLQTYLKGLSLANDNIAEYEMQTFFDWCDNELVESVHFYDYDPNSEHYIPIDESWRCGLSIYVPSSRDQLGRYDFLPIYKQTNLEEFMRLMFQ